LSASLGSGTRSDGTRRRRGREGDFYASGTSAERVRYYTYTGGASPGGSGGIDAIKAVDGCEHIYTLGNTATGSGLTIVVWRDKAPMEVGADEQRARRKEAQASTGITITLSEVYDTFAEL
jgi:hypothetical protein